MFPRTAILVLAMTALPGALRANEFDMGRRVLAQMHRTQDVSMMLQRLARSLTPEATARDPRLMADIEALQRRVGAAHDNMQGQYQSLLGVNVPGSPDVVNDLVKNWAYRKTAMGIYLLGATGSRNETRVNQLLAEAHALDRRAGEGGLDEQVSLLGLTASR